MQCSQSEYNGKTFSISSGHIRGFNRQHMLIMCTHFHVQCCLGAQGNAIPYARILHALQIGVHMQFLLHNCDHMYIGETLEVCVRTPGSYEEVRAGKVRLEPNTARSRSGVFGSM